MEFRKWLAEMMGSTGAIYDPKQKPKEDWNWQGAVGNLGGTTIKGKDPIKQSWKKKKES